MQTFPLVSVVMPTLNQARFLCAAIDSVLRQDYPNIELIVADGGSSDGTIDLLKKRQAIDSRLRWFSQKDDGPAEAINAALAQVRGTVVGWLNSDDLYAPGAVTRAVDALQSHPTWLMVYGHGQHVDGDGKPLNYYPTLPPATPLGQFSEGCFICQPTVFFQRSMYLLLGKLDENLKTAFDFDYWLRAFLAFPERIGFVDVVQAYSRLHEDCITLRLRRTVALEGMQVLARHLGHVPMEWLLTYVEELLVMNPADTGISYLRRHVHETLAEATSFLSKQAFRAAKECISQDKRLDQAEFPASSNLFAPEWKEKIFLSAISLGTFCHAAEILKCAELRKFSGPFDWLFSNLDVVTHCLADDFKEFLDSSKYQVIPIEERRTQEANVCDHEFYRSQFGIKYLFNHHDPTQDLVYAHFLRTVERFRNLHLQYSPVLFLMVTIQPVLVADYEPLISLLENAVGDFLLVVVRFVTVQVDDIDGGVELDQHKHHFVSVKFPVAAPSNGVEFPDEVDNLRFEAFIRSFKVSPV